MPTISNILSKVKFEDENFVGTIAFKSEEITLPDGSKMAIGIDHGHWVLIYQEPRTHEVMCFEYNEHKNKILKDKKDGTKEDILEMCRLISYFFDNALVDDVVTILPPKPKVPEA